MERMWKLVQAAALFSCLHALYRACDSPKTRKNPEATGTSGNPQKVLTDKPDSNIMEVRRVKDLPPWIRKIGRNYMFGYLRGVTTEGGYKKVISGRGRLPGGKRK